MRGPFAFLPRALVAAAAMIVCFAAAASEVPYPAIPAVPKAKGDHCVEPTEVMRRNHMQYILHQRLDTVHEGIRGTKYSLKGCIDCHVTARADRTYPTHDSKDHFCNACHAYAAVKIDCFECHSDHPQAEAGYAPMAVQPPSAANAVPMIDMTMAQPMRP